MDNAWASSFSINDTAQHCQEKIIKLLHCSEKKWYLEVIHVIITCITCIIFIVQLLYYEKGKKKSYNKIW